VAITPARLDCKARLASSYVRLTRPLVAGSTSTLLTSNLESQLYPVLDTSFRYRVIYQVSTLRYLVNDKLPNDNITWSGLECEPNRDHNVEDQQRWAAVSM
jgi:hypothetical protein